MILTADFTWPAIFGLSIKTQLYGHFYGKDKNLAILLTKWRKIYHTKLLDPSLLRLEYFLD